MAVLSDPFVDTSVLLGGLIELGPAQGVRVVSSADLATELG